MSFTYLNKEVLNSESIIESYSSQSTKYHFFENLLTGKGYEKLVDGFPRLEQFEKHEGRQRSHGQRPHDRYFLGYQSSRYHPKDYRGNGIAQPKDLSNSWRAFLAEIESQDYMSFLEETLGTDEFTLQYAWHMGMTGAEVSPHRDTLQKLSIHLFYFNPVGIWDTGWGGDFLILNGLKVARKNPDFGDFTEVVPFQTQGNRSLFLKNGPEAWHGVRPLRCPDGQYRRLFTVYARAKLSKRKRLSLFARKTLELVSPRKN
jgi:hypothetical protein